MDAERAEQVWDAIEYAFESEPGRRVVLDLTGLSGLDTDGLGEIANSARVAARRRDDLRLVVDPHGAFGAHLTDDLTCGWSIYQTVSDALE